MTKQNYLNELYSRLSFLPEQERREIMADYEEHFAAGNEKGKTEQQICEELGTPESIAGQYSGYRGESAPYSYNAPQKNTRSKASRSVYLVLMVLDIIFLAIPGYPAAAGLIIAAFAVIALSVAAGIFTGSALLGCFLVSAALTCLFAGLLIFALLTWSLKICLSHFQD